MSIMKSRIRVTAGPVGHDSKVEIRVGQTDVWLEIPVARADVHIRPGDLTTVEFEVLAVETDTEAVVVSSGTLAACTLLLRECGYTVETPQEHLR